jgi:phosphatidylserine/phosphatidylglycerophosphate/cardiolipin synthase-like enzyme
MGSANFTTGGLTTQANLIHTFDSPELARLYLERKQLLQDDPTMRKTRPQGGWSQPVQVGAASVRVFFPPEATKTRVSIDTIVAAVNGAQSSAVFCLFAPTDKALRDALFAAGDAGKMMFGLINAISEPKPTARKGAVTEARVATFNRSRDSRDVFAHSLFTKDVRSKGFWFETNAIPGVANGKFPVFIHHKFVVIDAETDAPTIYTGSANMSANSLHDNDENLLEIKGSPGLAHAYLAEFMRLYEHYRARAREQKNTPPGGRTPPGTPPCHPGFTLAANSCWAKNDFTPGTPEFKSRLAMTA